MAKRKRSASARPSAPLYTWRPDRRASRACIRHFVAKATKDKAWAATITDEWKAGASVVSLEMLGERQSRSVHHLARHALEYCRLRAFMPGAYGLPRWGDRPAAELWDSLNP